MKFGVTKDGFRRKTYQQILDDYHTALRDNIDAELNLTDDAILGRYAKAKAWEISELWEMLEDVYFSPFIDTAEGADLDNVAKFLGISRKGATQARGEIAIYGRPGTEIGSGFRVSDERIKYVYETIKNGVIGEDGKVTLDIVAIEPGAKYNLGKGMINTVVNPIPNITKVENLKQLEKGTDVELDYELRQRYERSFGKGGSATRVAIESALLDLEDVSDAFVRENDEMKEVNGLPPKSVAPVVVGAKDEEVARAILEVKAGGIKSFGTTEFEIEDSKGVSHIIGFTRPDEIQVYVTVDLEPTDGYKGKEAVQDAIIKYIGGTDNQGKLQPGLGLGQGVSIARVIGSIMGTGGIIDAEVKIGKSKGSQSTSNIDIKDLEIVNTTLDKVVINHV